MTGDKPQMPAIRRSDHAGCTRRMWFAPSLRSASVKGSPCSTLYLIDAMYASSADPSKSLATMTVWPRAFAAATRWIPSTTLWSVRETTMGGHRPSSSARVFTWSARMPPRRGHAPTLRSDSRSLTVLSSTPSVSSLKVLSSRSSLRSLSTRERTSGVPWPPAQPAFSAKSVISDPQPRCDAHQTTFDIPDEGRLPPNFVVAKRGFGLRRGECSQRSQPRPEYDSGVSKQGRSIPCPLIFPADAAD